MDPQKPLVWKCASGDVSAIGVAPGANGVLLAEGVSNVQEAIAILVPVLKCAWLPSAAKNEASALDPSSMVSL